MGSILVELGDFLPLAGNDEPPFGRIAHLDSQVGVFHIGCAVRSCSLDRPFLDFFATLGGFGKPGDVF